MRVVLPILAVALFLAGCSSNGRCCQPRRTVATGMRVAPTPTATIRFDRKTRAEPDTRRLHRADSGEDVTLSRAVAEWSDADVVAFGELHGNLEGAEAQLAVLEALHKQGRPVAMAMEFFERDTQEDLDAYLAGTLDKDEFLKRTKRNKAYAKTHGPLVEFCKANGIPVIAANAPRPLVTGYRKSGTEYATYLAGLTDEERADLPRTTEVLEDAYREKFMNLMGNSDRAAVFFKSQSLWDDAMAEAMADFRKAHPRHRILLIVGAFHVDSGLGTVTKYTQRRPDDRVRILVMEMTREPDLAPTEADKGTGDVVLKVPAPKPKKGAAPAVHPAAGGTS